MRMRSVVTQSMILTTNLQFTVQRDLACVARFQSRLRSLKYLYDLHPFRRLPIRRLSFGQLINYSLRRCHGYHVIFRQSALSWGG